MQNTLRLGFGFGLFCLVATGCSGGNDDSEAPFGSVGLAAQTTGPDGATYRITNQTLLWVNTADHSFSSALDVDGHEAVQFFELPPNDYFASPISLIPGELFELERTDGVQTELVRARFVGLSPSPFSIAANRTTSLTLPFRVPEVGDVTFESGRLGVDLDVELVADAPNQGQVTLTGADITTQTLGGALASADEYLTPSDASVTQTFGWNITGAFVLTGYRRACAPIQFTSSSTSESAWGDLLAAVPGSPGELCVAEGGASDHLIITGRHQPNFQGLPIADYLTDSGYQLYTSVVGQLPTSIFDGTTLHLALLKDAVSPGDLSASYWLVGNTTGDTEAHLIIEGPGSVQTWTN